MGALADYALCTLSEARAWVLRNETDGSQDTLLATLINGESKSIARYCAREFFPTAAATRTLTYSGSGYLDFAPFEIRTLTSIALLPAGWTTDLVLDVAVPDFVLEPCEKTPESTYLWARMPQLDNPGAWPPRASVGYRTKATIVADWGMTEIPSDVTEACLMAVDWRYKNPYGSQGVQIADMTLQAYTPSRQDGAPPFPSEVVAKLDDFRRPDIGV